MIDFKIKNGAVFESCPCYFARCAAKQCDASGFVKCAYFDECPDYLEWFASSWNWLCHSLKDSAKTT